MIIYQNFSFSDNDVFVCVCVWGGVCIHNPRRRPHPCWTVRIFLMNIQRLSSRCWTLKLPGTSGVVFRTRCLPCKDRKCRVLLSCLPDWKCRRFLLAGGWGLEYRGSRAWLSIKARQNTWLLVKDKVCISTRQETRVFFKAWLKKNYEDCTLPFKLEEWMRKLWIEELFSKVTSSSYSLSWVDSDMTLKLGFREKRSGP